jgi:hypothetical protein
MKWLVVTCGIGLFCGANEAAEPERKPVAGFRFTESEGSFSISRNGRHVANYFYRHGKIPRPFFARLHGPDGIELTRQFPVDATSDDRDHDTIHPGLWFAFGDLNGVDFWRNRGRIEVVRISQPPEATVAKLSFASEEIWRAAEGREVCRGISQFCFIAGDQLAPPLPGVVLLWQSVLTSVDRPLTFGPQHEMGLGIRMASPLRVQGGSGTILGSHGGKNEAGNWGELGKWWEYSGTTAGLRAGILLVPSPTNKRPVWAHSRDYGFLGLNPTGVPASGDESPSVPFTISAGERFVFRAGILLFSTPMAASWDSAAAADRVSIALRTWKP